MTYRQLIEALQALPAEGLDRPVTVHFDPPGERGPFVFPIVRVTKSGDVLAGNKLLGMMGDDLPILTSTRKR